MAVFMVILIIWQNYNLMLHMTHVIIAMYCDDDVIQISIQDYSDLYTLYGL